MVTKQAMDFGWAVNGDTHLARDKHTRAGFFRVLIDDTNEQGTSVELYDFHSTNKLPEGPIPTEPSYDLKGFSDTSVLDEIEWNYFGEGGWTLDNQGENEDLLHWIDQVTEQRGPNFFNVYTEYPTTGRLLYGRWKINAPLAENDYLLVGIQTNPEPETRVAFLGFTDGMDGRGGEIEFKTYRRWAISEL